MSCPRILVAALCLLCGGLWSASAGAASVCVSTPATLIQAINSYDIQPDGSTLTIKVVQGNYAIGNAAGQNYHGTYPNSVGLQILGGYTSGCASRSINPFNTVIDGQNQSSSGINFNFEYDANALIEGLTFTHFSAAANSNVLGLGLDVDTSDVAKYQVRYCRFVNNTGQDIVSLNAAQIFFVDNLVVDNTLSGSHAAAVHAQLAYNADTAIVIDNNTIANNNGGAGVYLDSYGQQVSARLSDISDNIVWGNSGTDLLLTDFDSANNVLLAGWNLYGTSAGFALDATNLIANPQFINPAGGGYGLAAGSPAINSGAPIQFYGFPSRDLISPTRVTGSRIDRGAFETAYDDYTGFVVTTAADNGSNAAPTVGSLRAAIKAANAAAGPFKISFSIAGACPRTLNLAAPMLDVTGDVEIDGNTQSGWVGNATYGAFDATLCLFVNGSGASTPWAFHVPAGANNARLIVRGVIFAGFSDAAIKIENGHNHQIFGNQFGAVGFTVANHDAIRITGSSGGAFIGGFDDPESVNLIAGTSDVGIYLDNAAGSSTLGNNVIGYQTDGLGNGGNPIGVYIFNSPKNALLYNYIGNSSSYGVAIQGAPSSANLLQNNVIGLDRVGQAASNVGAGVVIQFGAKNNTVGAVINSNYGANTIAENGGPGVWVTPSGGAGNRVLAGLFYNNAGIDIDLATGGASANQPSNPGSGANNLQNYPVLAQAIRTANPGSVNFITGQLVSTANTSYRLDVYYDLACDSSAGGRGSARHYLGRAATTTNAAGVSNFAVQVPSVGSAFGFGAISATATDPAGNTSEIGNCVGEIAGTLPVGLFIDSFE